MAQDPKTLLKLHFDKLGKGNLIKYESERFGEQNWQAKVILPDGRQFSGDIKGSKKESEKLAAQTALDAISTETTQTPAVAANPVQINWKGRLQEYLKQSVHYDTSKNTEGMFVSRVVVRDKEFNSQPLKSIKEAEQQVAEDIYKHFVKGSSVKSTSGLIPDDAANDDPSNWKGLLQELIAKNKWPLTPSWNYSEQGPEHDRYWVCSLEVNGLAFKSSPVKQQKDAAKQAAKKAVHALQVVAYGPSLKQTYYVDSQKKVKEYVNNAGYKLDFEPSTQISNGIETHKVTAKIFAGNAVKFQTTSFTLCTTVEEAMQEATYLLSSACLGKSDVDTIKELLGTMAITHKETAKPKTIVDLDSETPTSKNDFWAKLALPTPTARPNQINPKNKPKLADVSEPIKKPQIGPGNPPSIQDPAADSDEEEGEIVYKPITLS
jgi:dsRNA-specific ribonuclease